MNTAGAAERTQQANSAAALIISPIGTALAGGMCLAHVFVDQQPYSLIVPPKALREHPGIVWSKDLKRVPDALSYFDGLANTRAMAEAGSPLGAWALEQRIDGYEDWFIGARQDELAIRGNLAGAGAAYAPGCPEAFEEAWYWTSTQNELLDEWAWLQYFGGDGNQNSARKSYEGRAFVLRREPIR